MKNKKDYFILTGRTSEHIAETDTGAKVHKEAISELQRLQEAARKDGIKLEVASGFRDYARQRQIWNLKASGQRVLRDRQENIIDFKNASKAELLESILTWSALPGASRHHWGTEIDIFDANKKSREKVNLTQKECEEDFQELYEWLDHKLKDFNFHRPYAKDLGGVAMEPWHLSFTPLSKTFEREFTIDVLRQSVQESDLLLKDEVLNSLDWIYANFIRNVVPA